MDTAEGAEKEVQSDDSPGYNQYWDGNVNCYVSFKHPPSQEQIQGKKQ